MRDVAVTDGNKVTTQAKLGWSVDYYGIGDLAEEINNVTDEEADRLMAAMARFKEADPAYLEVLESFVNLVCSGEPFSVFGAKIDYQMVKNVILQK